ncbi:MAG: ribosome biogenesis/translation initiation ATPase RLI [Nanoarchaeota archaeon]|nr:ribosome biogenesis/translation initiation ATPase RLI [Nanoarchaeota archaeon]
MPRIAVVNRDLFNPYESELMVNLCPVNRKGEPCITISPLDKKINIDEKMCIGCGICVNRSTPGSIHIINLPDELASKPIHRYGQNGFHLYNLPVPLFGKVVGILGRNGIGKSTALKILSGQFMPNLGGTTEATYDDLISYFKGSEAQDYLERLKNKTIRVSYKPQQVDLIPKATKGTVRQLLERVDEKGQFAQIVKILDLEHVLDNDVSKVSGGELQRVAIAATVLRKADVYFFDEPSSYLDIKQRLNVSRFIRDLADEKTAVMVVEHDLIILDYMTEMIYLLYGKEGVYGICSKIKSTRNGINIYLSGFLRDENMRFRDKAITFKERAEARRGESTVQVSWTGIKKKLGRFSLESAFGSIHRKDIIGILGENGTGKTSFVKILAGVDKPDAGEIDTSIKVSYKPQYLDSSSDELVENVLQDAIAKHNTQVVEPLGLTFLFTRKINELSGGELQRVAIAICLAKEADVYLLDEPSAYLDVEQRLIVSKLIRDFMDLRGKSCMVVDHDLLFLDYLSEKLMVFEGQPAIFGMATGPFPMGEGMTRFLTELALTFRRDPDSGRPRINKEGSVLDREQKSSKKYYYTA